MDQLLEPLAGLAVMSGMWRGVNRLWFAPGAPVRESDSTAVGDVVAQGRGIIIRYTWAFEGAAQDGMLLVMRAGNETDASALTAVLIDSWHVGDGYMRCEGAATAEGVSVRGSYGPPDAEWGWRSTLEPLSDTGWRLRMYNVEPSGEETLAVEGLYEQRLA